MPNYYGKDVDLSTLEGRLTAARAGYLDELAAANLPTDVAALQSDLTQVVGTGRLVIAKGFDIRHPAASTSWVSSGASITLPATAGLTYSVVLFANYQGSNAALRYQAQLYGSVLGDMSGPLSTLVGVAYEDHAFTISRPGFSPSEVVTVQHKGDNASWGPIISGQVMLAYIE